jgi:hypothetical protein
MITRESAGTNSPFGGGWREVVGFRFPVQWLANQKSSIINLKSKSTLNLEP